MRTALIALAATVALGAAAVADAKNFEPGDLRLCTGDRCVAITNDGALRALGAFYYVGRQPKVALPVRLGARAYELRFRNGYVTGIVAGPRLDRFLSYGVYLERFRRGKWYAMPPRAARELRRLAQDVPPRRLTRAALARSR